MNALVQPPQTGTDPCPAQSQLGGPPWGGMGGRKAAGAAGVAEGRLG